MTLSKIYKAIIFTTIISLNLATVSSSVKAATLTLTTGTLHWLNLIKDPLSERHKAQRCQLCT